MSVECMLYHVGPGHLGEFDLSGYEQIPKKNFKKMIKGAKHLVLGSDPVNYIGLSDEFLEKCEIYINGEDVYVTGKGARGAFVHVFSPNEDGAMRVMRNLDPSYFEILGK